MILSGKTIRELEIITPHEPKTRLYGMSYGESYAGYDIRLAKMEHSHVLEGRSTLNYDDGNIYSPWNFSLGVTVEYFKMPKNILGVVHDKSSWARQGLSVFNTVIEPGWEGFLTLELVNHGWDSLLIKVGSPIAQVIFHYVDEPTEGYDGKYQFAKQIPQEAILG